MQIREATLSDSESIRNVHLQAFDKSEAQIISDLAVNLLNEKSPIKHSLLLPYKTMKSLATLP